MLNKLHGGVMERSCKKRERSSPEHPVGVYVFDPFYGSPCLPLYTEEGMRHTNRVSSNTNRVGSNLGLLCLVLAVHSSWLRLILLCRVGGSTISQPLPDTPVQSDA
jgi:hypothetical protein